MQTERRSKPRIFNPLPLRVSGVTLQGESYEFDTIARNLGSGGFCAGAPRVLQPGEQLSLEIQFALAGSHPATAPKVSARAVVLRSEALPTGRCVFAARLMR
jgi:hypothetical protein